MARLLLPHVRRSLTITDVLDANAIARERTEEAFNLFGSAIVLTNAQGGILFANRTAEAMFAAGTVVQAKGGILRAISSSAAAELRAAIELAARREAELGRVGLAIRLAGEDLTSVLAHVLPLTGSHSRSSLQPNAVAAVFIREVGLELEPALETVARLYKLTATELRVLLAIVDKGGVPEVAAALGISESTVRTHLKRLFEKTGTHRQVDLVTLVAAHGAPFT